MEVRSKYESALILDKIKIYAEEGKVYDMADDSEWKPVGGKIRINIR